MKKKIIGLVMGGILLVQSLIVIPTDVKANDQWTEEDYNFYMFGSGGDISEGDSKASDKVSLYSASSLSTNAYDMFAAAPDGMKMSQKGLNFVMDKEGIYLDPKNSSMARAYDDLQPSVILTEKTKIKGTITIGYGHTGSIDGKPIKWDTKITVAKAKELFAQDMNVFERPVNNFAKNNGIKFNQGQFDALVSFSFNVGAAWTTNQSSSLRKMVVTGAKGYTKDEVINTFELYNHSCGMILAGLTRRRRQEGAMYLGDDRLSAYKIGKYTVDQNGLKVRKGPGTNYSVVNKDGKNYSLSKGTKVDIVEIGDKGNAVYWGRIGSSVKDAQEWIQLDYCRYIVGSSPAPDEPVKPEEPKPEEPKPEEPKPEEPKPEEPKPEEPKQEEFSKGLYIVTAESLNVRAGAGTGYKSVGIVKKNEKCAVTEVSSFWGKTSKGWISLRYCTPYKFSKTTVKACNRKKGIELTWKQINDADGYAVYKYVGKSWKKYATVKSAQTLNYIDADVANNKSYKYRVYGYKIIDKITYYGSASNTVEHYRVPVTKLNSLKSSATGKISVSYSKVSKVQGYQIIYSFNSKMTSPKYVDAKTKTSKEITKLKSKKVYYITVRTYISFNGKRLYSPWSNIKSVKVK